MLKVVCFIFLILTAGCCSINTVDGEVLGTLKRFREGQVNRLVEYTENDTNLTARDKNTFRCELREFDSALEKLIEKN